MAVVSHDRPSHTEIREDVDRAVKRLRPWLANALLLVLAVSLCGFSWWSLQVLDQVGDLRSQVASRVYWLRDVERANAELERASIPEDLLSVAETIGAIADEVEADLDAAPDLKRETRDAEITARALASGHTPLDEAHRHQLRAQLDALPMAIRRETAASSRMLGMHWDSLNILVTVAILSSTIALGLFAYLYFVVLSRTRNRDAALYRGLASVDRLAAAGTLASGVAHEINNPLSVVKAALGSVEVRDASSKDLLAAAVTGADRIEAIVADLRCYADSGDESVEPVHLRSSSDSALRLASAALEGCPVEVDVTQSFWVLATDRRLIQALTNLVLNAVEAMRSVPAERRRLSIRAERDGGKVKLEIVDRGPGLAPHVRKRAFEPFVTTKPVGRGTGLGLFVCHSNITNCGGTVNLYSDSAGATAVVVLEIAEASSPNASRPRSVPNRAARVLIVDDERALGAALARSLPNHRVEVAHSGEEALEKLALRRFDAVVSDVRMPGMSGVKLHDTVRERWPHLERRFIIMSGGTQHDDLRDFIAANPGRSLAKPFRMERLRAMLDEMIEN